MTEKVINVERVEHIINLFGSFDENVKLLEKEYGVSIIFRDTELKICGEPEAVMHGRAAVEALLQLAERGEQISPQNVNYVVSLVRDGQEDKIAQMGKDVICVTTKGRPVKAKTVGQQKYVDAIHENTVTLRERVRPTLQWPVRWLPFVRKPSTGSFLPAPLWRRVRSWAFCPETFSIR